MMERYLLLKKWYEYRITRERLLLLFLCAIAWYAIFYIVLYRPLNNQKIDLLTSIKTAQASVINWQVQIEALNKISSTPLYIKWNEQRQGFQHLEDKYKSLLQPFSAGKWQDTINSVLQTPPNVTLLQIKNSSESIYAPADTSELNIKIYQQQVFITVSGSFFDIVNYLQQLEKRLTIVHWDTFHLQTTTYPLAKVDMEFSIFYE